MQTDGIEVEGDELGELADPEFKEEPVDNEIAQLEQFRNEVYKATGSLAQAAQEPLTFSGYSRSNLLGYNCRVATGILWINGPFAEKFWPDHKRVKPRHACPECGAKHVDRRTP